MNPLAKIESLLFEEFKTIPFHNFFMLNKIENADFSLGGTCSVKVLHFREVLRRNNIQTNLHSSFINNIECHRMLSVVVDNEVYFIDIGSGWPSLKLIPNSTAIEYAVYGMSFKTKIFESEIVIFHKTRQLYKEMIVIPKIVKTEDEILYDIENRYKDTSIYPFNNSLRFSIIRDDSFYFIKGNSLRIFNQNSVTEKKLKVNEMNDLLQNEFGFEFMKSWHYDYKV